MSFVHVDHGYSHVISDSFKNGRPLRITAHVSVDHPRTNGEAISFPVTFSRQPKLVVQFLRSYNNIGDSV